MKKTGQLLKDKREAAKLTISEVALATKINPKILNAIENGQESLLPAKTFLKGFLKSYALFLKMDPEIVLRSYQEEMGPPPQPAQSQAQQSAQHNISEQAGQSPVQSQPQSQAQSQPQPQQSVDRRKGDRRRRMEDENSSGLRTAAVIVIVLLIGVIIGVRELIEKYQREKQVEATQVKVTPLEQPPVTEVKPAETAGAQPTTPGAQTPPPAPQAAANAEAVAPAKPAQNEVVAPPPSPLPPPPVPLAAPASQPVAIPAPPPKPADTKAADAKAALPPPPPPVPMPVAQEKEKEKPVNADPAKKPKVEIILEALDKVEVKFQIKGETKRVSLGPTQVHTIRADQPVTLDLSDGGAVNIFLNGRERGVPGDLGKPKTIKIP